jgi:uncharacterized protein YkwD
MKRFLFWMLTPLLFLTVSLLPSERVGAYLVQFSTNPSALEVIAEVNALRASNNLPPYQVDSTLMTIAQSHADYIAGTAIVTHFSADGKRPYQRAIAAGYSVTGDLLQGGSFSENIKSGAGLAASEVVGLWADDKVDSNTLLSPDFKDVGVGMAIVDGVTYYVLDAGASTSDSLDGATSTPTNTPGTPSALVVINTPLEDGTIYHQVQKDEGLWSIALAYDTTIEQIKLLNGLATDEIFIGQNLVVQRPEVKTATPQVVATATFGIPTSTATRPVTPTATSTATPLPAPPASPQSAGIVVGAIIFAALLAAGLGAWLGKKKPEKESD